MFLFDTLESSLCYALAMFICPQLCKSNSPVFFRGMDSESHFGIELQEDNKIPKKSCKFGKVRSCSNHRNHSTWNCSCQCTVCHASSEKNFPFYVPATERQVANINKTGKNFLKARIDDVGFGHWQWESGKFYN